MLKMHFKTLNSRKISFDESKITKKAQGMLYFIKIYLPTNSHAYMMNIGRIITKKPVYNNMQMSFWAKLAKPH